MSLIPEFELGLWNAWIFVLSFLLLFTVWEILNRIRGQKGSSRPDKPPFNENEKKLYGISQLIFWASVIYSFFLPLKLGTAWFYVGLLVYLFGVIFTIVAGTNLDNTPINRPATKGLFRISRYKEIEYEEVVYEEPEVIKEKILELLNKIAETLPEI